MRPKSREVLPPIMGPVLEYGYTDWSGLEREPRAQIEKWLELHGHTMREVMAVRVSREQEIIRMLCITPDGHDTYEVEAKLKAAVPFEDLWFEHLPNPRPGESLPDIKAVARTYNMDGKLVDVIEDE